MNKGRRENEEKKNVLRTNTAITESRCEGRLENKVIKCFWRCVALTKVSDFLDQRAVSYKF